MCRPAYFEPAEIGGRRYVDGGVHSTTNADVVGPARPDLVVVSAADVGDPRGGRAVLGRPMRQIARLSLAREVAGLRGRGIPVVTFQPGPADLAVMAGDALDPDKMAPVCRQVLESMGRRLARADVKVRLAALADVA